MARNLDAAKAALAAAIDQHVPSEYPNARREANRWKMGNIAGETGDSLSINCDGSWRDYATGDHGSNLLELLSQHHGITITQAYDRVAGLYGLNGANGAAVMRAPPPPTRKAVEPPKFTDFQVPTDLDPPVSRPSEGVTIFPYRGMADELLGAAFRKQLPGTPKVCRPYYVCRLNGGNLEWHFAAPPPPWPLYNQPALRAPENGKPVLPVLLVSGEKCVEAVRALGSKIPHPTITWPFGDQSIDKVDWSPLAGLRVWYMYDNDKSGIASIPVMARALLAIGCRLKIIRIPDDILAQLDDPNGADVADLIEAGLFDFELLKRMVAAGEEMSPPESAGREIQTPARTDGDQSAREDRGILSIESTSEMAVADDVAAAVAGDIYYVAARNEYYKWDGRRYVKDEKMEFWEIAKLAARRVAGLESTGWKARAHLLSRSCRAGVVDLARTDPRVIVSPTVWNRNPFILNTPAGIVDLRTGLLGPHDPQALMTQLAGASPAGQCPRWLKFLAEALGDDVELIDWVQRWLGYCLTGSTQEEIMVFLLGPGGNGKGSFLETIRFVLGDYARSLPSRALTESKNDRHPEELARLAGARFVTSSEIERGAYWNESLLKELTGGDMITARFMRQNSFEFKPELKLIVGANNAPNLRGVDESMRRRLRMIAFNFKPPEPDLTLKSALRDEADGIMAWMLRGCLAWQEKGLADVPAAVTVATDQYFVVQDDISEWLEECCDCDETQWAPTNLQYSSYKSWVDERGSHALSIKNFVGELSKRGMIRVHRNWDGKRAWGYSGCRPRNLSSGSYTYYREGHRHN